MEYIQFAPKVGCEVLVGTTEQIYVAKRKFGEGQILCLAFDYNAPPFSEQQVAETFWHGLLSSHGKSPRHLADQYALAALQHEEETHKHFLSEMPTQVPLIKLLAVALPIYLLSFWWFLVLFREVKTKISYLLDRGLSLRSAFDGYNCLGTKSLVSEHHHNQTDCQFYRFILSGSAHTY